MNDILFQWWFPFSIICVYLSLVGFSYVRPFSKYKSVSEYFCLYNFLMMCVSASNFLLISWEICQHIRLSTLSHTRTMCDDTGDGFKRIEPLLEGFYISKMVELQDSILLLFSGKRLHFLQVFHHVGAIVTTWMFLSTRLFGAWFYVWINSFVHIIMFGYFFFCNLSSETRNMVSKWKPYVTGLQIGQFLMGLCVSLIYLYFFRCSFPAFVKENDIMTLLGVGYELSCIIAIITFLMYLVMLLLLFIDFAITTYLEKPQVVHFKVN